MATDKSLPLVAMRIAFAVRCDYPRFKKLLREFRDEPPLDGGARRNDLRATPNSRASSRCSSTW